MKSGGKKFLAWLGIVLLLGLSAGCSEAEKFSWEKMKETHYRLIMGKKPGSKSTAVADKGQAQNEDLSGEENGPDVTGTAAGDTVQQKAGDQAAGNSIESISVALYFSDQNGDYLRAEQRTIPLVQGLARATVEELIDGPAGEGLSATIPQGTRLLDIDITNGLCRVDLSREFRDNHWGGSSGEILTVYSLVNTLTQFPTVEKVEILVEGQKMDTLAGHMDLSVPVYRNSQIIKDAQ